jgi:predicted HicB family RNase H-like nuclease
MMPEKETSNRDILYVRLPEGLRVRLNDRIRKEQQEDPGLSLNQWVVRMLLRELRERA